jgi:organic radical activating enzyme
VSYLQITTKCNMNCAHCCYSCNMKGKHGDWSTIIDAIAFARKRGDESITIGGGEPTLHPRFFDILRVCLEDFDYVWMATNGSKTKTMMRLANIINGCDYESFETEDYCSCDPEDRDDCCCEPEGLIYQENKLTVALSQDYFHDEINRKVVDLWTRRANQHRHSGFEIRNVTNGRDGVSAQGRAKRTGSGWSEHCACPDIILKPDGKIKLCGCTSAPVIGDVWYGITDEWQKKINKSEKYQDERCYKAFKGGRK